MPKKSSTHPSENGGVAAVDRALAIVAALEDAARPQSLADIARTTGMYKSTLLRLLVSLERGALVIRRADQCYSLGPFALRLGRAFEATYRLKECVTPVMAWLIEQGTESPSFHVRHDEKARVCVFRMDSKHPTLDRVRAGDLLPLARGAAGRVINAFRDGVLAATKAALLTASFGERDPACAALAVPVFGPDGELAGALSLSGPAERFSKAAVKKMSGPLLAAGQMATQSLGGVWPEPVVGSRARPAAKSPAKRAK